ncbi:hypothetical protein ACQEU3_44530 [Spirillospora sp. CA-253888]
MSAERSSKSKFTPIEEWGDVYGFLDQVRARPGMFVRHGSLSELETLLAGYSIALVVHGIDEPQVFTANGLFAHWLAQEFGWPMVLGWAVAIEARAGQEPALEVFFRLVDDFRPIAPGLTLPDHPPIPNTFECG